MNMALLVGGEECGFEYFSPSTIAENISQSIKIALSVRETLGKSFDRLRTNGKLLIPFVVSLSNALLSEVEGHEWNQLFRDYLKVSGYNVGLAGLAGRIAGRLCVMWVGAEAARTVQPPTNDGDAWSRSANGSRGKL